MNDPKKQLDKEVHRARTERVLSTGASELWSWGMPPSQHLYAFTNLKAPPKHCHIGMFREV